jgi:hypothetical protein
MALVSLIAESRWNLVGGSEIILTRYVASSDELARAKGERPSISGMPGEVTR